MSNEAVCRTAPATPGLLISLSTTRDPRGYANKIFKEDIAGTDLVKEYFLCKNPMKHSK